MEGKGRTGETRGTFKAEKVFCIMSDIIHLKKLRIYYRVNPNQNYGLGGNNNIFILVNQF